jgi:hypothetical protein
MLGGRDKYRRDSSAWTAIPGNLAMPELPDSLDAKRRGPLREP